MFKIFSDFFVYNDRLVNNYKLIMTVLRRQLVSDKETKRVFHPLPTNAICFLSDCFVPNVYDLGPILSSVK